MSEKQSTIEQLKFPANVRVNPYQLLGPCNDSSLLYRELLDNSRDELIASKNCDTLWLKPDGELHIVADNGRGINVALSEGDLEGRTQMELAVGEIYAGGKYNRDVISSGMHGIGSSAVNAVSDVFRIACKITTENFNKSNQIVTQFFEENGMNVSPQDDTNHTGWYYFIEYNQGIKVREYVANDEDLKKEFDENLPPLMSTIVGFTSDLSIVKSNRVDFRDEWIEYTEFILERFYNKKIKVYVNGDLQDLHIEPFKYEIQKDIQLAHPEWAEVNTHFQIYLTFEFDKDLQVSERSGCVNLVSVNKGMHITFAEDAIKTVLKQKYDIKHDILSPGLRLCIILLANKVGFDSQTKVRLVNIDGFNDEDWRSIDAEIDQIFTEHNDEVQEHVDALNELAATYESLSVKEYIHQMINISSDNGNKAKSFQPIKLKDASAPDGDRGQCELFICEGQSAQGTIMKVRDPYYHAVMPLRGVSMNVSWKTLEEALENDEIRDIISAIGTGVDEEYDMDALRYDKIIIAADADADGLHISALILGVFASFMRFLVEAGHVYVLQSPFYKQDGRFIYRNEMDTLDKERPFERYKGLGSMHAYTAEGRREIEDVFLNPDTRHLVQVTPEDIELAIMTLGDKYTRKILMQSRKFVHKRDE